MKTLAIVYMVHSLLEFGGLAEKMKEVHVQKLGVAGAEKFFKEIERYWEEVGRRIREKLLDAGRAKKLAIFMDGLPNVDERIVEQIVQDMIAQKIPAYLIIKELQEAGAKVYGTEDPKLLLEEHAVWTNAAQREKADPEKLKELLFGRDRAIAKRINEVLPDEGEGEGEGLLFIGKAHDVVSELEKLQSQFRVTYL